MFIAIHQRSGDLVTGVEVADLDTPYSASDEYTCVLCQGRSAFHRGEERFDLFTHVECADECFSDPKNSHIHQTGCQKAIQTVCTELGCDPRSVDVEKGITLGGLRTTVDVRIEQPVPIVIEVCYRSRHGAMYRKLRAILNNGYDCYVICVVDGACQPAHTPAEYDRSLQRYGPIEVGRYAPLANTLTVGTRITDDIVDLIPPHRFDDYDYILQG